ncbi:MAG: hypothetical protein KatS3mg102_0581 [Planctomycetota bacterium]|nr:MAG: hypothetical protein KatS3mg102_0581 [Planctomycetota bacterium]
MQLEAHGGARGDGTLVLGIETSCDDTSVALVRAGREVLANVVASQHRIHQRWGGVVPEAACRAHLEAILPVLEEALARAGSIPLRRIDAIAVTTHPGLVGALLVGIATAKTLAWALGPAAGRGRPSGGAHPGQHARLAPAPAPLSVAGDLGRAHRAVPLRGAGAAGGARAHAR